MLATLRSQANNVNLSISELNKDVPYSVREMKNIDTKFGISVFCVLDDTAGGRIINVFLPRVIQMTYEDIAGYNLGNVSAVNLIYRELNRRSFIIDFE